MVLHDLMNFCALIAAGVLGSLIADPATRAMKLAVRRVRVDDRDR